MHLTGRATWIGWIAIVALGLLRVAAAREASGEILYRGRSVHSWIEDRMSHPDPNVRIDASRAMGRIGPAALPHLLAAADHEDPLVRTAVIAGLGELTGDVPSSQILPVLVRGLEETDEHARSHAARALRRIGPEAIEALPALLEALDDPEDHVRGYALEAAVSIGGSRDGILAAVDRAAEDPSSFVRQSAGRCRKRLAGVPPPEERLVGLGGFAPDEDLDVLLRAFLEGDCGSIFWTTKAIGSRGLDAAPAVPILVEVARGKGISPEDPCGRRRGAMEALVEIGAAPESVVPAWIQIFEERDDETIHLAAEAIRAFAPAAESAVPALSDYLLEVDDTWAAGAEVGRALVEIRGIEHYIRGLAGERGRRRTLLAHAVVRELVTRLEHMAPWLDWTYWEYREEILDQLISSLRSRSPWVRGLAVETLRFLPGDFRYSLPLLTPLLDDGRREVREAAAELIVAVAADLGIGRGSSSAESRVLLPFNGGEEVLATLDLLLRDTHRRRTVLAVVRKRRRMCLDCWPLFDLLEDPETYPEAEEAILEAGQGETLSYHLALALGEPKPSSERLRLLDRIERLGCLGFRARAQSRLFHLAGFDDPDLAQRAEEVLQTWRAGCEPRRR